MSMFGASRVLEPHPADEIARLAARPKFLQPNYSPATGQIIIDSDGSIRAGTLEAIAERLTCDPPSAFYCAILLLISLFYRQELRGCVPPRCADYLRGVHDQQSTI